VTAVSIVVISKNEPALAQTLERLAQQIDEAPAVVGDVELLVVDASTSNPMPRPNVRVPVSWIPFTPPRGVRVSIPHQRNAGVQAAKGDIIVFTDCGCIPMDGWLERLLEPILSGEERMVSGKTGALGELDPYDQLRRQQESTRYLPECPTINLAFRRDVFQELGGFDESFEYGSDVDFSWRAVHAGIRARYAPDAVVLHDWGTRRRQLKRAFVYGKARARLYNKHLIGRAGQSIRKRTFNERDIVPLLYPLNLLGLPIALRYRWYLLLPLATLWRARENKPVATLVDHVALGAGVLAGAWEIVNGK